MTNARMRNSGAFTLIELLVVVAVISILIGVLLPALGEARKTAQLAGSGNLQRQLTVGLTAYATENDGYIAGASTSGLKVMDAGDYNILSRDSSLPVQIMDWISPALAGNDIPIDRQARFYYLLENYSDPALKPIRFSELYLGNDDGGNADFDAWRQQRNVTDIQAVSFLMPITSQIFPGSTIRTGRRGDYSHVRLGQNSYHSFTMQDAVLPSGFVPRIERVGSTSKKIAIADGTHYMTADGTIDADFSYNPTYGSFTTSTPIYNNSTAYADTHSTGGNFGLAYNISYRHSGQIDAAFWDGHVEVLDNKASRNPTLWYPRGSILQDGELHPFVRQFYFQDPAKNKIP